MIRTAAGFHSNQARRYIHKILRHFFALELPAQHGLTVCIYAVYAPKSLAKTKERITQMTGRERTPIPLVDIVGSMNATLRGWSNYFHYRNSSKVLDKVKTHAEERLRTHLMNHHKVRNRVAGIEQYPRQKLYMHYGLYKVPTMAGWKTAHALV